MVIKNKKIIRFVNFIKLLFNPSKWFKKKVTPPPANQNDKPSPAPDSLNDEFSSGKRLSEEQLRRKAHAMVLTPDKMNVEKEKKELEERRKNLTRRESDLSDMLEIAREEKLLRKKSMPELRKNFADSLKNEKPMRKKTIRRKVDQYVEQIEKLDEERVRKIDNDIYNIQQKLQDTDIEEKQLKDKVRLKSLLNQSKQRKLTCKEREEVKELQEQMLALKAREAWESISNDLEKLQAVARERGDKEEVKRIDQLFNLQSETENYEGVRRTFNQLAEQTALFEKIGAEKSRNYIERSLVSPGRIHKKVENEIMALHEKMMAMQKSLLMDELKILISQYRNLSQDQQTSKLELDLRLQILSFAGTLWVNINNVENPSLRFFNEEAVKSNIQLLLNKFGNHKEPKPTSFPIFKKAITDFRASLPKSKSFRAINDSPRRSANMQKMGLSPTKRSKKESKTPRNYRTKAPKHQSRIISPRVI